MLWLLERWKKHHSHVRAEGNDTNKGKDTFPLSREEAETSQEIQRHRRISRLIRVPKKVA